MTSKAYSTALDACLSELAKLVRERTGNAQRINELDHEIASRLETAMSLSKQVPNNDAAHKRLLQLASEIPAPEPQLTEAVLDVLYQSKAGLTPREVKAALERARFDFSEFTNPLASVHSTLRRLSARPDIGVHENVDNKTAYHWTGPRYGARKSLANMLVAQGKR